MNDNRNMLLAVVLSMLVLIGWTFVAEKFFPTAKPTAPIAAPATTAAQKSDTPLAAADVVKPLPVALATAPRVRVQSDRLLGSINLQGARLDDLLLQNYRTTVDKKSPAVRLFAPSGTEHSYFAQFGWAGEGELPNGNTLWTASAPVLSPQTPVTLSWVNSAGVRFEIALQLDKDFMFTATQRIINASAVPMVARPFALVARDGHSRDVSSWTAHVGPMGVFDDRLKDVDFKELDEDPTHRSNFSSTGGWVGFADKYWLAALVPAQNAKVDVSMRRVGASRYQLDSAGAPTIIAAGGQSVATTKLFAGAKEVQLLDRYKTQFAIPQFDKAIDWGWFYFLTKPIFYLLDWLFRLFGNFGLAIIGLTLIVRILMYPIANKQFASMARMRVLQPRMKELQERYKDDRMRLQQEMMALYQKEKVNPLAGCLPILLQIPVFYALYKVLLLTIEIRHQPFVLWIKDLAAPDPLTPVNLFGLLPFQPPAFLALGILPILLGITMWLQQRLNPQPMDEVQQKIFGLMPWIFMFVMAPFAAGLQVYWVVNNILSIVQQWWLMRTHTAPAAAAGK